MLTNFLLQQYIKIPNSFTNLGLFFKNQMAGVLRPVPVEVSRESCDASGGCSLGKSSCRRRHTGAVSLRCGFSGVP